MKTKKKNTKALTLRVTAAMARRLERLAKADHRSMQSMLTVLLTEAIEARNG
jgi:hypothetical protein